jgi:hypothetical protein
MPPNSAIARTSRRWTTSRQSTRRKAGQTIPLKWRLQASSFATSWEDYYRYNTESNAGQGVGPFTTRKVDSLIFQARCAPDDPARTCANENLGTVGDEDGYLIDTVTYSTSDTLGLPVALASVNDPSVYGDANPFTASGASASECRLRRDLDPIETYTPGQSGLSYNAETGIWHYNWQTPKTSVVGKCVELTLDLTGDSSLFKFTK